jgi:dienelactone hydrolase
MTIKQLTTTLFFLTKLSLLAQTAYSDESFQYFEFKEPASKKEWLKRRTAIRQTIRTLFGKTPPIPAALTRPDAHKVAVKILSKEHKEAGYTLEKFEFYNGVDANIRGYYLVPDGLTKPAPAILYNHYHGGEYGQGKEELFKKNWIGTSGPGEALVRDGYVVMAIDAYAFGERQGQGVNGSSDKGKDEELSWAKVNLWKGRCLWGMMVRDDQIALELLTKRPEVDAQRIGTMGMSMGCLRSFWLAALDDRVKVTIAVACIVRNQELMKDGGLRSHGIYYYVPNLLNHFDNESIIACIAPRPLLMLSGKEDKLAPYKGVEYIGDKVSKVYQTMGNTEGVKSIIYEGMKHEFNPTMWAEAMGFLKKWL